MVFDHITLEIKFLVQTDHRWGTNVIVIGFQAHLAPGSQTKFDFRKYIKRSLEEDFKVVVSIKLVLSLSLSLSLYIYIYIYIENI